MHPIKNLQKESLRFMKLCLNRVLIIIFIFFFNTSNANNFNVEYKVSTTGIKIGYFNWSLIINNNIYQTEINLKNTGILTQLYKFEGQYVSSGTIEKNFFKTKKYEQYWKTKKKTKVVSMTFNNYLVELLQDPAEKELARINLNELYLYFDPITSFLNILNGNHEAKTIDGRRVYTLKKDVGVDKNKIILKINDYENIWADHKRNDLKKIEFYVGDDFLPQKILIYFKERVFKLEKI